MAAYAVNEDQGSLTVFAQLDNAVTIATDILVFVETDDDNTLRTAFGRSNTEFWLSQRHIHLLLSFPQLAWTTLQPPWPSHSLPATRVPCLWPLTFSMVLFLRWTRLSLSSSPSQQLALALLRQALQTSLQSPSWMMMVKQIHNYTCIYTCILRNINSVKSVSSSCVNRFKCS